MLHISMNVCKTWKLEISKKHFEIKLHLIFNESVVMEKKEIDLYQTAPYAALTPLCTCLTCFTPYNIERAHCFRRGAHSLGADPETENRNVECAWKKGNSNILQGFQRYDFPLGSSSRTVPARDSPRPTVNRPGP